MGKDTHLINIYLKIHNKRPITMDDLAYLAQYAPECFEKTCQNVVYNIPETKPIMAPTIPEAPVADMNPQLSEQENIAKILENLNRLETNEFPIPDIDAEEVKNLLGNLYMELLFPHNDKDMFIQMAPPANTSVFDKRA